MGSLRCRPASAGRNAGPSKQGDIMRNIKPRCGALCLGLCLGMACTAPVAAQAMPDDATGAAPPCRNIVGQTQIDGTMQQITGLACQQPDGTWQVVQSDDAALPLYPALAYPYYDPWYWGGFVTVVGGSFIFIDRFHHHYHMDHVHFGHGSYGWHGNGGMHGGFGTFQHGGGGMHR